MVLATLPGELRCHGTGADDAHAYSISAQILRHAAGQAHQAPFGRAIDSTPGERIVPRQGTDVYDMSGLPADHFRSNGATRKKYRLQICVHHGVPVVFTEFVKRAKHT